MFRPELERAPLDSFHVGDSWSGVRGDIHFDSHQFALLPSLNRAETNLAFSFFTGSHFAFPLSPTASSSGTSESSFQGGTLHLVEAATTLVLTAEWNQPSSGLATPLAPWDVSVHYDIWSVGSPISSGDELYEKGGLYYPGLAFRNPERYESDILLYTSPTMVLSPRKLYETRAAFLSTPVGPDWLYPAVETDPFVPRSSVSHRSPRVALDIPAFQTTTGFLSGQLYCVVCFEGAPPVGVTWPGHTNLLSLTVAVAGEVFFYT